MDEVTTNDKDEHDGDKTDCKLVLTYQLYQYVIEWQKP